MAVNQSANSCVEKEMTDPMPCCEDIAQELKVNEITKTIFDFDAHPNLFIVSLVAFALPEVLPISDDQDRSFKDYSPPLRDQNFQSELQVFLI